MVRLTNTCSTVNGAVYEELKRGIMTLRLAPGTVMSTQEMATRLNVSRTPVREAFLRLQSEGLVETEPQRLTAVSRIDLERVEQERFLRGALESAAITVFLKRRTPEVMAALEENLSLQREALASGDSVRFIECDNEFHSRIFAAAGQQLSWNVILDNNGHYNRIRTLAARSAEVIQANIRQHERMLLLIAQGDEEQLHREFIGHIGKLNAEKEELVCRYPDYFSQGSEAQPGARIGSL